MKTEEFTQRMESLRKEEEYIRMSIDKLKRDYIQEESPFKMGDRVELFHCGKSRGIYVYRYSRVTNNAKLWHYWKRVKGNGDAEILSRYISFDDYKKIGGVE